MKKKILTNTNDLNLGLYSKIKQRILLSQHVMKNEVKKHKNFFFFVFQVVHNIRFSYVEIKKYKKRNNLVRYERKVAPNMHLRIFALYSRILKHGQAGIAKKILSRVIVLLTENTPERSGCKVLNSVLQYLEPTLGLLVYRRGRNFYRIPFPLWPSRKYFLASRFLVAGARRRQKLLRTSFMEALFYEILDVKARKRDCFTLIFFKKFRSLILSVSEQSWRVKKRKF